MKNQSMVIGTAQQSGVVAPALGTTGLAGSERTAVVRHRAGVGFVADALSGVQPTTLGHSSSAPPIT